VSTKDHWENVYSAKTDREVSWTQADPRTSLDLIRAAAASGRVIDIGGGTSALAGRLLDAGYTVTVLDISQAALTRAQENLGRRASQIQWLAADVTMIDDLGEFDVWHDRAVFHFLTDPQDRAKYVALARQTIPAGGHLVIGTFALDGPPMCSGLPVERYDGPKLAALFGPAFTLKKELPQTHQTPWGNLQQFHFAVLQRTPAHWAS